MERKKKRKKEEEKNAKYSGHYVRPCTHNMHANALRSHKFHLIRHMKARLGDRDKLLGEPSKLKSTETCEMFPSRDPTFEIDDHGCKTNESY